MILEIRAALPFMTNGFVLGCEATRARRGDRSRRQRRGARRRGARARARRCRTSCSRTRTSITSPASTPPRPRSARRCGCMPTTARSTTPSSSRDRCSGCGSSAAAAARLRVLEGDMRFRFGDHEVRVHHTPGHSPGGVCLQVGPRRRRRPHADRRATRSLPARLDAPTCRAAISTRCCVDSRP